MAETFYPFVENGTVPTGGDGVALPSTPARIAVYDDMSMTPRVLSIEPSDIRTYLDEITETVYNLASERCPDWSFMLIRELVENLIHASFLEPTVAILDQGKTIVFSDQGPGIQNKAAALKPSFSSATGEMKRYIRGVGSGLPIVEHQLELQHGSITIEDNLGHGTIVTVSLAHRDDEADDQQEWDQGRDDPYPAYYPGYAQSAVQAGYPARQAYGHPYVQYAPVAPQYAPYERPYGDPYAPGGAQPYAQQPFPPRYGAQGQEPYGADPYGASPYPAGQRPYPYGTPAQAPRPDRGHGANGHAAQGGNQPEQRFSSSQPTRERACGGSPDAGPSRAARSVIASMVQQQPAPAREQPARPAQQERAEAVEARAPQPAREQQQQPDARPAQPEPAAHAPREQRQPQLAGMDAHVPLTAGQRDVIMLFGSCEKIGPKELYEGLGVAPATGSRRLRDIAAAGFIVKKGQKYVLTGEGRRVFALLAGEGN